MFSPGTRVITLPGLNPSERLKSVTAIGLPPSVAGVELALRSSRRPVSVDESARVK